MLNVDQHRAVLGRLVTFGRAVESHEFALAPYSNLTLSFLLHQLSSAQAVLALHRVFGDQWYPTTSAYALVRTLFEVDVTAHYISRDPDARARRYIDFGKVLKKRRMDACSRHRGSPHPSWREGMELEWQNQWAAVEQAVNSDYELVRSQFEPANIKGKLRQAASWSGKKLYEMAIEVDHAESYELFYADLSSFAHADVRLANRFLKLPAEGPVLSQSADEADVANVFRYAATFLTCFLQLFGTETKLWGTEAPLQCWEPVGA